MAPVRIFSDFSSLTAHLPRLHEESCCRGSFFASLPWFENLYRHGFARPPHLVLASDDAGCLPLYRDGHTLHALSNYYSSEYGALGPLPAALPQLLQTIGRPACVNLAPLDPASAEFNALRTALAEADYRVDDYFCFGNWYLPVVGRRFADYLATRPAQLQNNIRRGRSRLDKAGAWQIVIRQQADEALESAIADFVAVYKQSWKQPEPNPEFIPALCRTAAREGWLRLGILYLDARPIAAQLWLVHNGTAGIFKLAYVESAAQLSAGTVLSAALFEHAIDADKVDCIDYLTGDEPYKRDWMSHRRERRGIIAYDPRQWRGLLGLLRHRAGRCWQALHSRSVCRS